jgi:hypothetical protein
MKKYFLVSALPFLSLVASAQPLNLSGSVHLTCQNQNAVIDIDVSESGGLRTMNVEYDDKNVRFIRQGVPVDESQSDQTDLHAESADNSRNYYFIDVVSSQNQTEGGVSFDWNLPGPNGQESQDLWMQANDLTCQLTN